jgi:hypothetical protein
LGYRTLFGELPLQTQSERLAENNPKAAPKPREKRSTEEWRGDPLSPTPSEPRADAERLLRAFLPKAFRRPVPEALLQHYVGVALRQFEEGTAFDETMIECQRSVKLYHLRSN